MTTLLVIIVFICIPLAFVAGGFVAYKGVQLGLRWQLQTKQEQPPTLDSPIQPILDKAEFKQQVKQAGVSESVFNEWVHGPDESR